MVLGKKISRVFPQIIAKAFNLADFEGVIHSRFILYNHLLIFYGVFF